MNTMQGQPRQGAILCSTDEVSARDRAAYWNETISIPFPGLTQDWLTDKPIHAQLESRAFADARVSAISNTPVRVTRTPQPGCGDAYQLLLHLAGGGHYLHAGRECILKPGDLVLLDAARSFDLVYPSDLRILIWHIPKRVLLPLFAAPDRAVSCCVRALHGPGAVLASYARTLAREAPRLDQRAQCDLQTHLCSLIALTLGATAPVRGKTRCTSWRLARRRQVLEYVEAHLGEHDLGAERVAHALGMSRRWLHALFEQNDCSFAAWIVQRRLEECVNLLNSPAYDHLSITEIAFRSGFHELSTFHRQFRARYAKTPRDVRRTRGQGARAATGNEGPGGTEIIKPK